MTRSLWKRFRLPEIGLLLASLGLTFALAEGLLRLGIRLDLGRLRDPSLYTHPFCDDDYHKLRWLWTPDDGTRAGDHVQHPRLGWVPDPLSDTRQLLPGGVADAVGAETNIALFGDSFMAGVFPASTAERIAPLLAAQLPQASVVDGSVSGYGVDQIYLRFADLVSEGSGGAADIAVFGILLDDLDRVIEQYRDGPKPYFVLEGESFELRGVPIEQTSESWIADHPLRFRSFLMALARRWFQDRREWRTHQRTVFEDECRRDEKEELNRRILDRLVSLAGELDIRPIFVIFYGERALTAESWREPFLKATLDELGVEVLDTRNLMATAAARGVPSSQLYFPPPNGHPSPEGNRLIADALVDLIAAGGAGWSAAREDDPDSLSPSTIRFGRLAVNRNHLLRRGWETDADHFSWTMAHESSVQLPVPETAEAMTLEIEILCALHKEGDDRLLEVAIEEETVESFAMAAFPPCWTPTILQIPWPAGVRSGRVARVSLHLDGLLTPREAGFEIEDDRRLGLAVGSIRLRAEDRPR